MGAVLVLYTIIAGLLVDVPKLPILNETIRNLYFHVTMWFGMIFILTGSLVYSIRYLSSNNPIFDIKKRLRVHTTFNFVILDETCTE